MKSLDVRALGGGPDKNLKKVGFYRFTGQAKQLIVPISPKPATPAGYIDQLELKFATGDDDLRGGNDNVNVLVSLKDGTTQAFENVNNSNRWADRTSSTVKIGS